MAEGVRLKSYIDAVNAEQRRTGNMRALAIVGTFGALVLGIQQAVKIQATTADKLLSLHNDLIRKSERATAEIKAEMATKAEVEPIRAFVDNERGSSTASAKFWAAIVIVGTFAVAIGFGLANLTGAG